jgi:hypothetical protein
VFAAGGRTEPLPIPADSVSGNPAGVWNGTCGKGSGVSEGQQTEGQSSRYLLVEVGLTNGETLMGEPAGEARLQANFALF